LRTMSRLGTGGAKRRPKLLLIGDLPSRGVEVPRLLAPYAPPGPIAGFEKTARVRTKGFSNPTVMTRKGRASPRRTGLMEMSRYEAVRRENMKATQEEQRARVASQNPREPELERREVERRRMLRYSETKVECMRT
jgi:hypothetical protein